jgi:hypothetical protein
METRTYQPETMETTILQHQADEKPDTFVREAETSSENKHTLSREELLILLALASLSLMAALDGTSISVALPV